MTDKFMKKDIYFMYSTYKERTYFFTKDPEIYRNQNAYIEYKITNLKCYKIIYNLLKNCRYIELYSSDLPTNPNIILATEIIKNELNIKNE
jgi:hypothetical protein